MAFPNFYPDYCKTEIQKAVYDALTKPPRCSCVNELDYLGFPQSEIFETLKYFETRGLFEFVQHLGGEYPVIFSVK